MSLYNSNKGPSSLYAPEKYSKKANAIVIAVFCLLFGGAFFYSLQSTLTDLTQRDCNAGVQKACDALK